MQKLKTAVIGVGYLGKFHAEKLSYLPHSQLVAVCDINRQQCEEIAKSHDVAAVFDYKTLVDKVDAVTVVVPTALHYSIAKFFLDNKIHVLVEKPITATVAEADQLIALAKKNNCVLQVGHLERFNCTLQALKHLIKEPHFIESYRLAPFKTRGTDVNVVLDLMIHDIDIIQDIVTAPIESIAASGTVVLSDQIDLANARIQFTNGCVANVTASRVSTKVTRKLRFFQHDAYISLDLHNKKFDIRRKGISEVIPGAPEIIHEEQAFEASDALRDELASFLDCILHNKKPMVSGEDGKRALATAIEITRIVSEQEAAYTPELSALTEEVS